MPALFDMQLRAERRDRAARCGGDFFLHQRVFADCLERIELLRREFRSALLLGCPDRSWPALLGALAGRVKVADPGPLFASAAGGSLVVEDRIAPRPDGFDLILAVGTLDTIDDLPSALRALAQSLSAGGLLIGALSGGDTLPRLRAAMRAADQLSGGAQAHVHPRIEPSALVNLLGGAGLERAVVDVDRFAVSYPSLVGLVRDLRGMAATNILVERPRNTLSRAARDAAMTAFASAGSGGQTVESFEVLHFAGWRPDGSRHPAR